MTEKQAMDKGYKHTGLFSFDRSEMLHQAMLIRKKGNVCFLIPIRPYQGAKFLHWDKAKTGYAIYWKESPENREARKKLFASKSTKCLLSRKRLLEIELEDIDERLLKLKQRRKP